MKSKNQVYVAVSSKKVAKKLKKVLNMFGEETFTRETISGALIKNLSVHFRNDINSWCNVTESRYNKTKVTVKQLKQILFREHAKEGDVVVVDNGKFGSRWVLELTGNNIDSFEHSKSFDLKSGENDFDKFGNSIAGGKFIRYATEEEKALLNLVKELEVGKWYWGNGEKLIFVSAFDSDGDCCRGYGIGANGKWYDDDGSFSWLTDDLREATKEEVESALRKEAEKRYKVGDILENHQGKHKLKSFDIKYVQEEEHIGIFSTQGMGKWLLYDGKWAEVIEQEKTLEQRVKELEDFIYGKKEFIANIKGEDLQLVLERRN